MHGDRLWISILRRVACTLDKEALRKSASGAVHITCTCLKHETLDPKLKLCMMQMNSLYACFMFQGMWDISTILVSKLSQNPLKNNETVEAFKRTLPTLVHSRGGVKMRQRLPVIVLPRVK